MTGSIHKHRWQPDSNAAGAVGGVYILHGIGEHAGRYERLARHLVDMGFVVGAHDHPGHGKSSGKRGVIQSTTELELTAADQFAQFENETGGKAFLFGHSLGGLVAASMVLNHDVSVKGLMLSAPAFSPIISRRNKFKLAVLNLVAPRFSQQLPYDAQNLTHDETEQEKGTNDPLNHRYKSVGIVMWLVNTGQLTLSRAKLLDVASLMLVAGDDVVVDAKACQQFSSSAPAEHMTEHHYDGFRHEILNETPERRNRVLADIGQWLTLQENGK